MYLNEIANLLGNYKFKNKRINKIRIDSRLIEKDDVFITINDGYKYIDAAIKNGAALIITNIDYNTDIPIIKIDNPILVLGKIAKYIRNHYTGTVIAITGSNGKTTTKDLLSYLLSNKYKVLKSIGSQNNHIGIPNTLLELDNTYDFAVLELGTNHPGEIDYLTNIVNPNIAIITNIGSSHIGNFGSLDNIFKEKISIKKDNTILFVNGEDNYLKKLDCIKVYKKDYDYKCNIDYLYMNYYLVFKVCEYLKMNIDYIYTMAKKFKMSESRMNKYVINGITLIDDAYNASYESVVSGINSLIGNRKIIILGDMLELGEYTEYYHEMINKLIGRIKNKYIITIGKYANIIKSNNHFNNINDLLKYLELFNYKKGDIIYIKGAHKIGLYKIVPRCIKILQSL